MEVTAGERKPDAAVRIGKRKANMAKYCFIECLDRFLFIRKCGGLNFVQHKGVTTHGTLTKNHHVTGQDVSAFYRDRNRHTLITAAKVVIWPKHNTFTAMHIHGVIHGNSRPLGEMIFTNGRDHRGLFTQVYAHG